MKTYTQSGIRILNDVTKDLDNLNELGIYLAKQTDIDAIKTLKLLVLASEDKKLDKPFDINSIKTYKEKFPYGDYKYNETVFSNLSMNPQYFSLELMEFILHNYEVNLNIEPFDSKKTLFDFWLRSFSCIEYDQDRFYKRYDMIDKKLEMLLFMVNHNLLNSGQIYDTIQTLTNCISKKYGYSEKQIMNMEKIINALKVREQQSKTLSKLAREGHIKIDCKKEDIINKMMNYEDEEELYVNRRINAHNELSKYEMLNDQCCYMIETVPSLIKKGIIK